MMNLSLDAEMRVHFSGTKLYIPFRRKPMAYAGPFLLYQANIIQCAHRRYEFEK
jgi:hypothetical protein